MREPSVTVYTQERHALNSYLVLENHRYNHCQLRALLICLLIEEQLQIYTSTLSMELTIFLKHVKNTSPTTISESVFGRRKTPLSLQWLPICLLGKIT